MDQVAWYTTAWFDKYVKRDASADKRLLTTRWHNDAAEAAIDPDRDGNMYSFYYRSRLDIRRAGGGRFKCEDIRSGCAGPVVQRRRGTAATRTSTSRTRRTVAPAGTSLLIHSPRAVSLSARGGGRGMHRESWVRRCAFSVLVVAIALMASAPAAGATSFSWIDGYDDPGHAGRVRQGRDPQRGIAVGAEHPGPRARDVGERRVLPAAREADRRADARLAGVVGRASREPARGPFRARPREARRGHAAGVLRLLPRLSHRPEHHRPLPPAARR